MNWPTELKSNQVFVFGSNEEGFHGAGGAGYAFRGTSENTWRSDNRFLAALDSYRRGTHDQYNVQIGKWAIFGVARGLQQGLEGSSYAIATVTRPGRRRSIPLEEIKRQIFDFWKFAYNNEKLEFLVAPIGTGYAGYTDAEMRNIWFNVMSEFGPTKNVTFLFDMWGTQDYRMS